MYPVLETERVILKPFQHEDFERVFELINAYKQQNEGNDFKDIKTIEDAKRLNDATMKAGNEFIIIDRKKQNPIGWVVCDKASGDKIIKRTYLSVWIRNEYRHIGLGRELLEKLMNFSFYGVGAANVVTNVVNHNKKAYQLMERLGFEVYNYLPKRKTIDDDTIIQFIISKEKYTSQEYAYVAKYEYELPKSIVSPYSFDKPIRKIDTIEYIKQPTDYLCGQSVIAMLAGVSVDEVVEIMQNDKGTSTPEIRDMLKYYGIKTATKARQKYTAETILPSCCILSVQLPGYGHWSLYYQGKYYDPEFGVLDKLPAQAKLCYYWEIM